MEVFNNMNTAVFSSLQIFWLKFINFLPSLIIAIIVFIAGLFLGDVFGKAVARVLKKMYLDKAVEKTGLKRTLEKIGFKMEVSRGLGLLVTWFLYAIVLIATAEILDLAQISQFLQSVVLYIPNVIVAVIVVIVGMIVGNFISVVVKEAALAAKLTSADFLAAIAKWAILIFSFMAALIQLKVAPELIQILFTGVILMIALAGGIAFGLGGKDKAKELIDKLSQK